MKGPIQLFQMSFSLFLCLGNVWGDAGSEFIANGKGPNELQTPEYISIVEPFLPLNPYILEAGAHSGEDTAIFAEKWPQGQVFAFEPVPHFFQLVLKHLKSKNISNVTAFPFGLFSSTGDRAFYYSQSCGGASSYLPDGKLKDIDYNDTQMTLPCMTLDDWALKHGIDHIDFMWLDMEGAEYHMLSASSEILKTVKVILTELNFRSFREGHTLYDTLKPFLEAQGFTLHMIWGSPYWQGTGLFIRTELIQ